MSPSNSPVGQARKTPSQQLQQAGKRIEALLAEPNAKQIGEIETALAEAGNRLAEIRAEVDQYIADLRVDPRAKADKASWYNECKRRGQLAVDFRDASYSGAHVDYRMQDLLVAAQNHGEFDIRSSRELPLRARVLGSEGQLWMNSRDLQPKHRVLFGEDQWTVRLALRTQGRGSAEMREQERRDFQAHLEERLKPVADKNGLKLVFEDL